MKRDLVVNPFVQVQFGGESENDCFLVAPRPNTGLRSLLLRAEEYPDLCELFLELSQSRLDFMDPELDLNETQRELLYENGVLVDADAVPDRALFCCLLDDVGPRSVPGDASGHIVNPTFEYAAFEFTDLAERLQTQHLSARPSVWITQPITGIRIGYWLDAEQAAIISKFEAGKRVAADIDPPLVEKMAAAGIITTPESTAADERRIQSDLAAARNYYLEHRYVVLPKLLPAPQMAAMRKYFRQYISNGFMPFDDSQSERFYQHNEPLATVFHRQLTKLMSIIVGEEVVPSYVYAASYVGGADLKPHTDRAQCEFSISFQVDYLPEPEGHLSPWGLFVRRPDIGDGGPVTHFTEDFPAASQEEDRNTAVYLASGDGLVYKGRELIHYRYRLPEGRQSTSLFFHYVPKTFDGELR